MSSPILKINLFGDFNLTYNDKPLKGLSAGQFQSLLSYLLLNRHAPQLRQKLAFLYWSDLSDAEGLTNLRRKLYRLRKILPNADCFIQIDSKTIRWQPDAPFWLDVAEFESAIASAEAAEQNNNLEIQCQELKQALQLYRGELLVSCDDEWVIPERDRLQQLAIANIEKLIAILNRQGDYNAAIIRANQLLKLDPYYEKGYQSLMQLHADRGDRASALQIYHQCMTVLREELGVDPAPSTQKLYQRLLTEESPVSELSSLSQPSKSPAIDLQQLASPVQVTPQFSLVGRKQEWQRILHWQNSPSQKTPLLLITGEPGIGKTRLLEEIVATANNNLILWGSGFEAEKLRPYGAWIDALRTIPPELLTTLPAELSFLLLEVDNTTTSLEDPSIFYDAVVSFLSQLTPQQPIVIFDDLQWLDEASIALLHYVTRSLYRSEIKFVCTLRTQELKENQPVEKFLQALRRDKKIEWLELKPLNSSEIENLTKIMLAQSQEFAISQTNEHLQRIYTDSGGNPLFALETARALWSGDTSNLGDLASLIGDRLKRLTESSQTLLPWAAALGHSFEPTLLAEVADFSLTRLLGAMEQLEHQGILRPNPSNKEQYDFVHDIVRRVAYDRLSLPRRRLVHLQIAQKLEQKVNLSQTKPWEIANEIAYHATKGDDHLLAATSSLQAAKRCLSLFAYTEAAQLSKQGIEHCQKLAPATVVKLKLELLQVQAQSGMTYKQVELLETEIDLAIAEARSLGQVELETVGLETLIKLNFLQDRFTALQTNSLRVEEVGEFISLETSAKILSHSGGCMAGMGREMERAEAMLLEAQSLANRSGLKLAGIYYGLGCVSHYRGQLEDARTHLQQSINIYHIEQNHWDEWVSLAELVMVELEAKKLELALKHSQNLTSIATKLEGGSEPAFSQALETLAYYARDPTSTANDLKIAIASLAELDAQRKLAYVLTYAAEIALESQNIEQGVIYAENALEAARIVVHPSDIALAWSSVIQGKWIMADIQGAIEQFTQLQEYIINHSISDRAEQKIIYLEQQLTTK